MKNMLKILILTALCLIVVGISSCSAPHKRSSPQELERTEKYWFNLGRNFERASRYEEAVEAYKQAIEMKPDYADAYYNLGVAYGELGMHQEAVKAYKQATMIAPDFSMAYYGLGYTYNALGRHEEAVEAYKQAVLTNPDYAEAHYGLGYTYSALGRDEEAVEAYKQAVRINPDYAKAYYGLGNAYYKITMYQEAVDAYKQAIRIMPDYTKAHYMLGDAYAELEMYGEAIKYFERASEKGHRRAKHALAWIFSTCLDADIRDGKRALTIIKPLVDEGNRDSMTLSILAAAYAENGNFSEAIKIMLEAIEKTDKNEAPEYYKKLQLHLNSYENKKPMRE